MTLAYGCERGSIPLLTNGGHRPPRLASVVQPDRFRTTDLRTSALNARRNWAHFKVLQGGGLEHPLPAAAFVQRMEMGWREP